MSQKQNHQQNGNFSHRYDDCQSLKHLKQATHSFIVHDYNNKSNENDTVYYEWQTFLGCIACPRDKTEIAVYK